MLKQIQEMEMASAANSFKVVFNKEGEASPSPRFKLQLDELGEDRDDLVSSEGRDAY